jgi:hypothetical protein
VIYYGNAFLWPFSPCLNPLSGSSHRIVLVPKRTVDSRCDSLLLTWSLEKRHCWLDLDPFSWIIRNFRALRFRRSLWLRPDCAFQPFPPAQRLRVRPVIRSPNLFIGTTRVLLSTWRSSGQTVQLLLHVHRFRFQNQMNQQKRRTIGCMNRVA